MSNVQPSVDPVPTLLEPAERTPFDNSVAAGLVGLAYLARQAFEEKRRRQCLEITDAILRIEPEHSEARTIQSSVRSELECDFASAKTLVHDAKSKNDPGLYAEASGILRRVVDADPENLEAQNLLHETVAAGHFSRSSPADRPGWSVARRSIVIGLAALVVTVAVFALLNGMNPQVSAQITPRGVSANTKVPDTAAPSDPPAAQAIPSSDTLNSNSGDPQTFSGPLTLGPVPMRIEEAQGLIADVIAPPSTASLPPAAALPVEMGQLAVNATVPVEIYRRDQYLGSTPTTLQLPPGPQTLEYRYQGLRQTLTHSIKARETTTAIVSFPVRVQINAKPWANVSLEGTTRTLLGQTPLGNVSVPIGSVLVFQNPGFSDKRYRVTAKDATIQVTFP